VKPALSPGEAIGIFLRGLLMGGTDIVPGVSGGTMAFITGIYPRLINAIAAVRPQTAIRLLRGDIKGFREDVDAIDPAFLIVLLAGIGTAALLMSQAILFILNTYPGEAFGLFLGIIVASSVLIAVQIESAKPHAFLFVLIGLSAGYLIGSLPTGSFGHSLPVLFVTGMIALCAMILPGISGAYLTLILGQYEYLLQAIRDVSLPEIITFIAGGAVGILLFSRALRYLLNHYTAALLAILTGLMLGSTRTLLDRINEAGGYTPGVILACIVGVILIGMVEYLRQQKKERVIHRNI
jgi:putative membrane protein